jgi:hypothetical protein
MIHLGPFRPDIHNGLQSVIILFELHCDTLAIDLVALKPSTKTQYPKTHISAVLIPHPVTGIVVHIRRLCAPRYDRDRANDFDFRSFLPFILLRA